MKNNFMKIKLMLLIFFPLFSIAQKDSTYTFKKQLPVYTCMFFAGASYGAAEALIWHNPYPDSKFFNPYLAWKEGHLIDGYHTFRLMQYGFTITAVGISLNEKFRLKDFAKKVLICSVSYWCGQQITWHLIK